MAEPTPLPPWPAVDFAAFGPVETTPVPRMQSLVGTFLTRNWTAIPHVTHHDEIDITLLEDRRKAWNADVNNKRLSPLILLIKAVAGALQKFPAFNSSLDASGKIQTWKKYYHIGIATETPGGLLVPVIRDCDSKDLGTLATELAEKSERARSKGLPMAEMSGGCFSISSLGNLGGIAFTPIINAPEVAILGVCPIISRPVQTGGGGFEWRKMLPLSLSYDHRVINGADAARFVTFIGTSLQDASLFAA